MIVGLQLENFRSYPRLQLAVPPAPLVFLVGPNGAGKTNLLEALSILGGGRGLRGAQVQEMIREGHDADPAWVVNAEVARTPLRHKISQALTRQGRLARLDQKPVTATRLRQLLPTVALTPGEDNLFRGGAEARRTLLDRFATTLYPDHRGQVSAYARALRERNALLRAAATAGQRPDAAWLTGLEAALATHGVALAHQRRSYMAELATAVAQDQGPFPAAILGLLGDMEAELADQDAADVEAAWRQRWHQERRQDLAAGRTRSGPHRSDLAITYRAKGRAAAQCSTGEQKALLLSLFIGQARLLQARGVRPLLLLDEVAAHLDAGRRLALMSTLVELQAQTWITGTDRSLLLPPELEDKSQVFTLQNSRLIL